MSVTADSRDLTDTRSDLRLILLRLSKGQRCLKTQILTWILCSPNLARGERSAGVGGRPPRQGTVPSVCL